MENFDLKKYLAEGKLLKEAETSWNELDWDFSDLDSVNFRDFEVDNDQFLQASKKGYVIDNDGVKRIIDKLTLKYILQSYKENQ